jgi:hypothetical protein
MAKKQRTPTIGVSRALRRDDAGVSIIEVLAASLIFLILSVGVAQATVTAIRLSSDQRARITALSLAATEIDKVRAYTDVFAIDSDSRNVEIDGTRYTVARSTEWVNSTGLDIPCGAGGTGNMQYKRINVRVTWDTRMAVTQPVSSDTVLAPDGRINDPTRGTIMVSVKGASGTGSAGVAVTITPTSGGATLDSQPDPTNAQGCTYALKVMPGTYSVTLSKSGYIGSTQDTSPSQSISVTAGSTVSAPFDFDRSATLGLIYGSNSGSNRYATNNETTFVNTYGTFYKTGTSSTVNLYPFGGYTAIAGHYVAPDADGSGGCRAVDPSEWEAATVGGTGLAAGVASDPIAANPGGSASATVRMGIVRVKSVPRTSYVTAVSVASPAVSGQPSCAVGMTYSFAREATSGSGSSDRDLVLPFGTWKLYYSSSTTNPTQNAVTAANIDPQTNVAPRTAYVSAGTVTLDPRMAG